MIGVVEEEKVVAEEVSVESGEEEGETRFVEEIELPVEGSESECTVMAIEVGRLGSLVDIDSIKSEEIRESMRKRAGRLALKLYCKEKITGEVFSDVIVFSFHPRARYPKIAARYGKIRVGDTLKCRVEGGRWKIV